MSLVGAFTKADLTKMGTYVFIALIGLLFAMLLNIFLRSSTFDLIISLVGVVIFSALTAYDTQKIVKMSSDPRIQGQGSELMNKLSIVGALSLYLDFLNLFPLSGADSGAQPVGRSQGQDVRSRSARRFSTTTALC